MPSTTKNERKTKRQASEMGRGLSELQQVLMTLARRQGFIAPYEAVKLAWEVGCTSNRPHDGHGWDDYDTKQKRFAAIASRSLRRLVERGLLTFERREYVSQANVY